MERATPKFHNDLFSKQFEQKVSQFKYTNLLAGVSIFNELIHNVILDYKFNRSAQKSYPLLQRLDALLKEFLQHYSDQPVNEKERKALMDMLNETKKNPILLKIRAEGGNQAVSAPVVNKKQETESQEEKKEEVKESEEGQEEKKVEEKVKESKGDIKEFEALLKELREKFDDHKIDDAYELKERILQLAKEADSDEENKKLFSAKLEENKTLIEETELWYNEVHKILAEMNADEGYIEDKGPKNYTLKYKPLPDGKAILKMEGPLKIPLFNILALMYEADGFNHWVPFCSGAKLIKPLHRASHVYWLKYGLPPPLTARECHCFGYGADRFDRNGSIFLLSRSIDNNQEFLDHYGITIPKETKFVRMDIDVATEFTPINNEEMIMRQVVTVDPKVKHTPPMILNWISRKTGQHMFETMLKKAKNLKGTMWEKGINSNKEFYGWLKEKVDHFLQEHELVEEKK